MVSNSIALCVKNVTKLYGQVQALRGASFEVRSGEVFGLLGPNGAGKTSLISIIVTLEQATSGQVTVFGHDVVSEPREVKRRTGWMPQEIINHGFFNAEEILTFHAGYYGVRNPRDRIAYLLNGLGLYEHRHKKVKQLSGGMKRRLMIAKALVHEPGILLLDEPTAGVDVELRSRLWEFVNELRGQGLSILLTTHYLEEAELLCDRVAIINKGSIRTMGPTRELIQTYSRKRITLRLVDPVRSLPHPDLIQGDGREWVYLTGMDKTLGQLCRELNLNSSQLADVQIQEGKLEDVFLKLTAEGKA
jgi:ABC-2 type transport system ATP-binding protein